MKKFHLLTKVPIGWVDQNSAKTFWLVQPVFRIFLVAIWQLWTFMGQELQILQGGRYITLGTCPALSTPPPLFPPPPPIPSTPPPRWVDAMIRNENNGTL